MTPITKQDPVEAFRLHIAELRRIPDRRGPSGRLDSLLRALIISIFSTLADLVEQLRARKLAATAAAAAPDAPPQSGCPEHRSREVASGGAITHGPREQPELAERIAEAPHVGRTLPPPCRMPEVEQPAGLPPPPRARVRRAKHKSRPAPARPRHVHDGCWPRWRGPALLWTPDAGISRLDSKKWVSASWDKCAHFVTM